MEKMKEMELEILLAIRDNETMESNQFFSIFGNNWPLYKEYTHILTEQGSAVQTDIETMPGMKKYKLTTQGNNRVTQLLNERSHAVQVKLANLRRSRNLESSHRDHSLFSLFTFVTFFSNRFKRQVH